MTTAEAIEGITDAGNFEILATRVLRIIDSDCEHLEHLGVNAEGKTIKNPVDGFCLVPGSLPPRFIMAAFATDRVDKLERKWIFDHSLSQKAKKAKAADDGDLIKAARRAELLRETHPDASFVVWLCTNRQPDDVLIASVLRRAQQLEIEVRFLSRSKLRDTLDTTREGQWLRKEHLGIEAERLSFPLFRELAIKSLNLYSREFLITLPEAFVETESERFLSKALDEQRSVYLIKGASGTGKSVTCFRVLRSHLAGGGLGLWIPGEIAASAPSLEAAIGTALRALYPAIEKMAGEDALSIVSGSRRFLLVVDDIARGGTPVETLRKILSWRRPVDKNGDQNASLSIVVPAWDLYWAPFEEQFRSAAWMATLPIRRMEEGEACGCLTAALGADAARLCAVDSVSVVNALSRDPILIALYAASVKEGGPVVIPALADEVIDRFVHSSAAEAAVTSNCNQVELISSLLTLAGWMLAERDLYPRWDRLQEEFLENTVRPIRSLVHQGKICRLVGRDESGFFEFRHDRILEHFLSLAIRRMFTSLADNIDVISDPYYANYVGRALVTGGVSEELIKWIEENAPLALFTAVQFLPATSNESSFAVVEAATRWLQRASHDRSIPSSLLFEASRVLQETDSVHVLKITQALSGDRILARARLANGVADGIIGEFSDTRWFSPAVSDRELDSVIQRALHRHKDSLIKQCSRLLVSGDGDDSIRRGALVLAGYLGDRSLGECVQIAWSSMKGQPDAILPALWAELRCADFEPMGKISPIMNAWALLPDDEKEGERSDRIDIASELDFSLRRGIPLYAIDQMILVAQAVDALRWPITVALKHLDDPSSITFLLKQAAERNRKATQSGGFSMFLHDLREQWNPNSVNRGRRLPPDAIETIRAIWESESFDVDLREVAFKCWIYAIDDLDELRGIPGEHPHFQSTLFRRVCLGDTLAAPLVAPILESDPHWLRVAWHVWSAPIQAVVDDALAGLVDSTPSDCSGGWTNEHYALAELLRDIPAAEAEPLLLKHWGHLMFSPLFVQAALYIGSTECVKHAQAAINCYPEDVDLFKHIDSFFGFFTSGLMDRLEQRHLDVLLPFIHYLDDHELSRMAEYCRRHGKRDWAINYLMPEFDSRRRALPPEGNRSGAHVERMGRHLFPADGDLLAELDRIEQRLDHLNWDAHRWSEQFEERGDDHLRWRRLLENWLSKMESISRIRVAAAAINGHGTRADLSIIESCSVEGYDEEVDILRGNATFAVRRRTIR